MPQFWGRPQGCLVVGERFGRYLGKEECETSQRLVNVQKGKGMFPAEWDLCLEVQQSNRGT